jgi:hypothetical protein
MTLPARVTDRSTEAAAGIDAPRSVRRPEALRADPGPVDD